ncbi:DUF1573 domain-containing protein [Alistipes sp.]|uniref:DUF1573 domain-containing protein n=1 Tax=Alistipes sp. TaxID=1872444 RepID=UPI003A84F628
MKQLLLMLLGSLLMTGAYAADPARAGREAPEEEGAHLRLEETSWNFGDVPRRGGDLMHEFRFVNDGDRPLVLVRVITSCSCIRASFSKRPVAPADSGVIRIIYQPHKSEPGAFNKVVQIYSNSVDGRDILTVQGNSLDEADAPQSRNGHPKVKNK